MSSKYPGIVFICGLFLILGVFSLNQIVICTPDSARYLVWANSLAKMEGFKDATGPETSRYVVHAPLYPLLLAPGALVFPDNIIVAKATTLILGTAALFVFFLWLRKRVGKNYAYLGTLLLALNPLMTIYSTQILSDVPFALCLILYFIYAEKISGEKNQVDWHEYILIASIVAGVFLREVGVTLILSGTVLFALHKQYKRAALIFLISVLCYMIWFIRNEVIIAGLEHPALRNTQIFLSHCYTTNQESLLTEFAARLSTNLSIYINSILRLIFMPGYVQPLLSFAETNDPFMSLMVRSLPMGQFIVYGITLIFCIIGIRQELKNPKTLSILSIFLVCYFIPIILYPVNDVRFLFPLLMVMIYFWIVGLKYIYESWSSFGRASIKRVCTICSILFLFIPSIAWLQSYIRMSWDYSQSPEKLYDKIKNEPKYPDRYVKPFSLAGQWIVQNSDPTAIVACYWKDLTFSLKGRKLIEVQPQFPPDYLDTILRDYGVSYIVAVILPSGLSELESVLDRSHKFSFSPVYRVGNVEVLEVKRVETGETNNLRPETADSSNRAMFQYALTIVENKPAEAGQILWTLNKTTNNDPEVTFQIGVAKEFNGDLDSATSIFKGFRSMPQGLSYVNQSWYHLEMIASLKNAISTSPSIDRALAFHVLAIDYWNLGYRTEAINMLKRSLEIDSTSLSVRIILSIFSLQRKDTINAQKYFTMAKTLDQSNITVKQMEIILKNQDSLKTASSPAQQVEIRMKNVAAYTTMGRHENAIDELITIVEKNPANPEAFKLLAEFYEIKRCYSLALKYCQRLKTIEPNSAIVNRKIQELSSQL